jgi:hypothetical protein
MVQSDADVPPTLPPGTGNVLEARIRSNQWRLAGMGSGFLVTVLTTVVGSNVRALSFLEGIGWLGIPLSLILGWIFAPAVVKAGPVGLLLLVFGVGIVGTFIGWLVVSAAVVMLGLLLGPASAGDSLTYSAMISAEGFRQIASILPVTIGIIAMWAVLVRAIAARLERSR